MLRSTQAACASEYGPWPPPPRRQPAVGMHVSGITGFCVAIKYAADFTRLSPVRVRSCITTTWAPSRGPSPTGNRSEHLESVVLPSLNPPPPPGLFPCAKKKNTAYNLAMVVVVATYVRLYVSCISSAKKGISAPSSPKSHFLKDSSASFLSPTGNQSTKRHSIGPQYPNNKRPLEEECP